jgi:HK97 family phage portal protein
MNQETRILWLPSFDSESRSAVFDYENNTFTNSRRNYAGVRVDSVSALQSTVVLACVRVLAESIASLPLHVYRRREDGGKVVAREHPLYRILHTTPNSWQTSFEWREQQMLHLGTYGQAFCEIVRDSRDIVSELVTLHPSRMRVERLETGALRYLYQEETGGLTTYGQDQIMHIRWLSDDGVNGIVPVELARDAIGLARACEIHGASFFGNGARPGVVLATDNVLSAEAAESLRNNWERVHRGPDRAAKTAVLQGGLKPMEIGSSNQESQFLETRRFQIEEICRLYRVPPHLVGDLTRSSFSNIEQQSIDFVQHTLVPWLRRFETAFIRDLMFDTEEYFIEFDTRGLLRGDAAARGSYYSTLYNLGVASINEIRSWENLDPVDGGDLRFVGLSMQTLGEANAKVKAASESPPAAQPTADIGGLTQVMQQVAAGSVSPEAALSMMKAVFPALPDAEAGKLLAGVKKTEEEQPAQPAEPEGSTEPQPTADVNGLLAVLGQVGAGAVTPEAALAIIRAVFPTMPEGLASAIVAGVQGQVAPPADPAAAAPASAAPAEAPLQAEEVEKKVGNAPAENQVAEPEPANNEGRAAPDGVEVGDFVSWSTQGNRTRGRITRIVKNGVINVPDSDFNITGTPDDPAALIRLYREESGQWKPTDTLVAHKLSSLTKINDLESRVFCSTGAGGGKDSSCSPKDAGSSGSLPDASDLTKVRSLGGSTGAMLAQDKSGNSFVVKGGNSPEHIRSEAAANAVYEAAGVSVPRTKLDESNPGKPKQISEYVEAKTLASVKGAAREKAIAEIQKGFAADALLANWDVVGLEQDNILVPKSGPPLRVDNGGSLTFRAQGKDKPFGPEVGELDSLRTSQQGKPIFGSLKDEDIASQIGDLSARRDKILAATPEPLRSTMSQRLDYMEKWAKGKSKRSQDTVAESRVFCSTGPGGGKDASCSPKDTGGGGAEGSLKVVSKSSIEAGKTYKITKLGKEYHGKCTAVSHSDDGKKTSLTLQLDAGGKKQLTIMSAAKVQEKMLAQAAQAETAGTAAWKKDVEKLIAQQDAQSKTAPGTKVGGKGAIPIPETAAEIKEEGTPASWKIEPKDGVDDATPEQKAVLASSSAQAAIKSYTGTAYAALNAELRASSDAKTPSSLYEAASRLSTKMDAAHLGALSVATELKGTSDKTLYRGGGKALAKLIASMPEGGEFIDEGFGSTSSQLGVAQNFGGGDLRVVMRIQTPWGLPIKGVSGIPGEHEHLQPRNMRYRVGKREWRRYGHQRILYADVIGVGPDKPSALGSGKKKKK